MQTSSVYLLHFSEPYRHARHYLGTATDVPRRVAEHNRGGLLQDRVDVLSGHAPR